MQHKFKLCDVSTAEGNDKNTVHGIGAGWKLVLDLGRAARLGRRPLPTQEKKRNTRAG
jgi:hypothetical protein